MRCLLALRPIGDRIFLASIHWCERQLRKSLGMAAKELNSSNLHVMLMRLRYAIAVITQRGAVPPSVDLCSGKGHALTLYLSVDAFAILDQASIATMLPCGGAIIPVAVTRRSAEPSFFCMQQVAI